MPDSRPRLFDAVFTPELRDGLVETLERAYETARELHDPDRGSNEMTFGFGLYNFAVHELGRLAADGALGLESAGRIPFRLLAGGHFKLGCHRVGRSASENIWSAFPENSGAAATLVEQPYLPGDGFAPDVSNARNLILAHMGNSEDGLCAVYLCVPTREENDRITEWGFAELVWRREEAKLAVADAASANPEEVIEPIPLVRKKSKTRVDRE